MTVKDIKQTVEELEAYEPPTGTGAVTVTWRSADPAARPTGLSYTPPTEAAESDDSATLKYDAWDTQEQCLAALEQDIVALLGMFWFVQGLGII